MSLPESYTCRLPTYSLLEKLFASNATIPYPSHVYIYGNNNTGKSTLVKHALDTHNHSILWFDCREIYSLNMFYQTFLSSLAMTSIPSMKNFNDFVRVLRDHLIEEINTKKKKSKSYYFVVFHHIELLLNYDSTGHILYLLFKLNELTLGYFNHSLILIGHQPFYQLPQMNRIEAELGVLTPINIFVPAYTRTEISTILQNSLIRMKKNKIRLEKFDVLF
jgi:Cdc6-like AAA superfamily ATPase